MKTKDNELDYEYTEDIKCPHCDYVFNDSWEIGPDNDGEELVIECHECGKDFTVAKQISVTYSTYN